MEPLQYEPITTLGKLRDYLGVPFLDPLGGLGMYLHAPFEAIGTFEICRYSRQATAKWLNVLLGFRLLALSIPAL